MDFDAEKPAGSGNFQTVRYSGRPTDGNESRTEAETAVYDFLDRTGVEYVTLCHPAAFTMEECEAVRRDIGAPVFKNLFLTNRQQTDFYLLMIPADKPFKTKYLSSQAAGDCRSRRPRRWRSFCTSSPEPCRPWG